MDELRYDFIHYIVAVNEYEDLVVELFKSQSRDVVIDLLDMLDSKCDEIEMVEKKMFKYFGIDEEITTEELKAML